MNLNAENIDELIGKYLAGEADEDEITIVESWAKQGASNRQYIEQLRTIFQGAVAGKELQVFDTDAAWIKLRASLGKSDPKIIPFMPPARKSNLTWVWRIAASVTLAFGMGFFLYTWFGSEKEQKMLVVAAKETVTDTLPDGSHVVLNKETALTYSVDAKKKTHTVNLKGEAYFNIRHDTTKTFIIEMAGVYVKDIGTAFNVKAYPESNTIEVVVETGEVMFYTDTDSGIYLRANGKGVYNKNTKTFTIDQPEENVLSYKTRLFTFSDTDLNTVIKSLNSVYPKQIVLKGNLQRCRLTVSFNNESQDEIITIIAETLGLTIHESGEKVILEGSGCGQE